MIEFLKEFFSGNGFMPHGHCYLWNEGVLWLHIVSDALITLAYFSIPFTLVYFVRKRKDLEFHWMFICFAVFIVACGATHLMEIVVIWRPMYWLSGAIKAVTALASVPTAILLVKLIPEALQIPSPSALRKTNSKLEFEISERKRAESELERINDQLEQRVAERTAALERALVELKRGEDMRSRLAAIVESSDDAIISTTLDGVITSWNSGAEKLLGYSAQEVVGRRVDAYIPPEAQQQELDLIARIAGGQPSERLQTVRLRKDGSSVNVSVTVSPIRDDSGKLTGVARIARDITQRKLDEDQLKASLKETSDLKAALDEHAIVAITNPQGQITYVNDKFCAISKYSREELVGQDHRIINSGYHSKEFIRELWETISRGKVWKGEIRNRAKDGSIYWVDTTIVPFLNAAGKPMQYVAIRADITERKLAEEEVRKLNRELSHRVEERTVELENANQELEAFCYSVSHDLRAPLRHIDGFVTLLQKDAKDALSDRSVHYMRQIADSAKQMGRLIDDLLVFSRMSRADVSRKEIVLDALFDEVISKLRPDTEGRNIQWKRAALPTVTADPAMLRQVVINLLSNAIKYSRPRNPAIIELGVTNATPGETTVFVRDNGVGFDMAYADKLFGVFQRLHAHEDFEGTGIGLANVRRIIARHGGHTWAESEPDRGATFYFSLPNRRTIAP